MSERPKSNPEASDHIEEKFDPEQIDTSRDLERVEIASSWAEAAQNIANLTGDQRAKDLVENYLENGAVGHDTPKGVRKVGSTGTGVTNAVLVPVLKGDEEFSQRVATYWEGNPGFITFNCEDDISETWKGFILLHELVHADSHDRNNRRGDNYEDVGWWEEEIEAFTFEHGLMATIGGKEYEALIERKVQEFLAELGKDETHIPPLGEATEIEDIFGVSLSGLENGTRRTAVWFDVVYRAFDKKYGLDSAGRKIAFTRAVYGGEAKEKNMPSQLFHASQNRDIKVFEPHQDKVRDPIEGPKVFATPDKALASCFIVPTDSSWVKIGRFDKDGVPGPWKVVVSDEKRFREADKEGSIYSLPTESFSTDPSKGMGEFEWTSADPVAPDGKEDYESGLAAMKELGVDVLFVDKDTFTAIQTADDHGESIIEGLKPSSE